MAANINNRDNRLLNANRRAWGLQARVAELEGQAAARAGGAGNGVVRQDRDVAYNYNTVLHRLQGVRAELSTSEPVIDNFIEVLEDKLMGVEGPDNPLNAVAGAYEPAAKRLKTLTGNGCHCPVDLVTLLTPDNVFIGKRCNHLMTEASAVLQLANGNTRCPFRCGDFVDAEHLANIRKARTELEQKGAPDVRSPDEQLDDLIAKQRIVLEVRDGLEVVGLGRKAVSSKKDVDEANDIVHFSIFTIKNPILKSVERPFRWHPEWKRWVRPVQARRRPRVLDDDHSSDDEAEAPAPVAAA
jgi:hypothetical protein